MEKFRIEWNAVVGENLTEVSDAEEVFAESATDALNKIRGSIISKLSAYHGGFFVRDIKFVNVGKMIHVSKNEAYGFIYTLNAEGGLATDIPKHPPQNMRISFLEDGTIHMVPEQGGF